MKAELLAVLAVGSFGIAAAYLTVPAPLEPRLPAQTYRLGADDPRAALAAEVWSCERKVIELQDALDKLIEERAEWAETLHGHQQCSEGACELPGKGTK